MIKFISKSELDSQKSDKKKTHYVGTIYPQIFSNDEVEEFKEDMQMETGIIWLGAYWLDSNLFPKEKCPECSETMISDGIDIPILSIWDKKTIRSFESSVSKGLFPYAKRLLEEMYPDNRIEICGIQMHYEKNNVFKQGGFYILPKGKTIDDYPDLITYLDDGTRCMAA